MKTYTQEELVGRGKLELKQIIQQEGYDITYNNATTQPELVTEILDRQEKRAAVAPPPRPDEQEPPAAGPRGRRDRQPAEEPPPGQGQQAAAKKIRIACGASSGNYPVIGLTVGAARAELHQVLNIGSEHMPRVRGSQVDNDYVLKEGDDLEFVRNAGDKA